MDKSSNILLVGHNDIMENALLNYLSKAGFQNVYSSSHLAINSTIQPSVYDFFQQHRPDFIFLGSTLSGGIKANEDMPADFIYHNLQSASNIFYAANKFGVKKIVYFASSCVYPRECAQPMKVEDILTGSLEKTSEPYSIAKIAGISMAQSFRKQYGLDTVIMIPATVYGPGFDQNIQTSHVIGALIHKCVSAQKAGLKEIEVWGSGKPRREFLFVDDFVEAAIFLMENYSGSDIINVGMGSDVSITELITLISDMCGFDGQISFNEAMPDGVMQKMLDVSRMNNLGWKAKTSLEKGLNTTINWFKSEGAL